MKILFICKYNRFRSRVAEAYFKKRNKNKNIKATSAGLVKGFLPLDNNQVKIAKRFGVNILGKPKTFSMDMLKEQDKIIVIVDDIPKTIFNYKWYKDKVTFWKIKDVLEGTDNKGNERIIKSIFKKVDALIKKLEKK